MPVTHGKLVIIGAGNVGSALLNSVLHMNILDDIVVINRNKNRALGEVLDASQTTAFAYSTNASIRVGDYSDCRDAHMIVITAGPSIQPGNSRDRSILLENNIKVMDDIMKNITRYTRDAILIMVSNPLDILTYYMCKKYDYPPRKIFGTGTLLDTARFNKMLADICQVDAKNVTGFVLGEHGATSFIPWNTVNIVGIPFDELPQKFELDEPLSKEKLLSDTKVIGLDIVELKGYTSSGIALSACRLIGAIVRNEHPVLPVSCILNGQYGLDRVAMSLPCIISRDGIDRILEIPLDENAHNDLMECYSHLRSVLETIGM